MMNWLWVGGWGVDPEALKNWATNNFPSANHFVILPARLDRLDGKFDHVIGWSWGGFRVLEYLLGDFVSKVTPAITLVAPFLGFCSEDGLGGKCSRIHVNVLKRWMARNPIDALRDFYQRAGLPFEIPSGHNKNISFWASELDKIIKEKLDLHKTKEALAKTNSRILVGEFDPLVDASWLAENLDAIKCTNKNHDITMFSELILIK